MPMNLASAFTSPPWSPNRSPNNERDYVPRANSHQWAGGENEAKPRVQIVPDTFVLHGGLYDSFRPIKGNRVTKAHRVILKYRVYLLLTKPIVARRLVAIFKGLKSITVTEDTGMGVRSETYTEQLCGVQWVLWDSQRDPELEQNRVHEFSISTELPPKSPRTMKTKRGNVSYELLIRFDDCQSSGAMHRPQTRILVDNPFSVDANNPWPGVEYGMNMEDRSIEMVGSSYVINPRLRMFVEKPDQCVKGGSSQFPVHILFQSEDPDMKVEDSVSHIQVCIVQHVYWLYKEKHVVTDTFPVTDTVTVYVGEGYEVNSEWLKCYLPLPDNRVHGRFDSKHFLVRHDLELTVHHPRTGLLSSVKHKSKVFTEPVEIFHKDLGLMMANFEGYYEAPVGANPVELARRLEAAKAQMSSSA